MADIKEILISSQLNRVDPSRAKKIGPAVGTEGNGASFDAALDAQEIKISKHAEKRLDARQIELSSMDRTKLKEAVSALEKKGAKDSLILMGELAFVVNVPSKTVVTAMAQDQMKENVFTNIDSTILMDR